MNTYYFGNENEMISGFMSTFFANSDDRSMQEKFEGSKVKPFLAFRLPIPVAFPLPSSSTFLEAKRSNIFSTVSHKNSTFRLYTAAVP